MEIALNNLVTRQTIQSPFTSWNWIKADDELTRRTHEGFARARPGYRDGVLLVPIDPEGIFTPVVTLKEGDSLVGEYKARRPGEEPRKSVRAASTGDKIPAKYCEVVIYRKDVLAETGDNSTDADWEIVSVNGSPVEGETPITPETLIANHFGLSGGTQTNMTPEQFVNALRESVMFWKDKAMMQ